MADKRISGFPAATQWHPDAFIPQDNPAGLTEKVTPAQVETKLEADGFIKAASPSLGQVAAYTAGGWAPIKLADANIDAAAAIGWEKISKSGAVATDVGALPSLTISGDVDANSINSGAPCIVKFQSVTSWTNFPFANALLMSGKGGVFTQLAGKDSGISQCWTDLTDGGTYRRNYVTAYGWSPWYTDWDSYNLPAGTTGKALLATASQAAARSAISALPTANPTATGTLTAPDVIGGLARMQASAVSPSNQAWFGYTGLNSAGAYVGYYPGSDGAVRIAAASGKTVSIGTGAAYGQLVISDSGVASSSLAGTGTRAVSADSTGKLVSASKPDFAHTAWAVGSSTLTDVTNWDDPLVDEAHYKCFAAGKHISATATETRFRFIIGGVSSSTFTVYSKGDWTVNFDVTTISGAGASVCANLCVYGNNATTICVELSSLSYASAYGIRLQIASDDDNADMRGLCTRLERIQ